MRNIVKIVKDQKIINIYTLETAMKKYPTYGIESLKSKYCSEIVFSDGYRFIKLKTEEEYEAAWDKYLEEKYPEEAEI